jgi:hypothetical protein
VELGPDTPTTDVTCGGLPAFVTDSSGHFHVAYFSGETHSLALPATPVALALSGARRLVVIALDDQRVVTVNVSCFLP